MERTSPKTDFSPLLEPGFHIKQLEEIKSITVTKFPNSTRRPLLFSNFEIYCQILERYNIPLTIWIDGSFVTEKEEPDDIDVVVLFDPNSVSTLSKKSQMSLFSFSKTENALARFNIHAFFVNQEDREMKAYWRGLFSFQRDEITPKGLIILEINNG